MRGFGLPLPVAETLLSRLAIYALCIAGHTE